VLRQLKLLAFVDGVNMLTSATYADVLRPSKKTYAGFYDATLIIGGSLLIGLCAQLAIGYPVPITGQTFAVLMIGALYGSRRGSLCVLTYIVLGVAGLPVFAHGKASFAVLLSETGGYIVGFVPAAYITGLLAEKGWDRGIRTTILAMALGNTLIYAFGLFWLFCLIRSIKTVLILGLFPFIVGDLLKIALAAILLPSGWKLLRHAGLADNMK
jgi:biotin transporter BioY